MKASLDLVWRSLGMKSSRKVGRRPMSRSGPTGSPYAAKSSCSRSRQDNRNPRPERRSDRADRNARSRGTPRHRHHGRFLATEVTSTIEPMECAVTVQATRRVLSFTSGRRSSTCRFAVVAHAPPDEFCTAQFERQPCRDIGVVIHVSDDDLVALLQHLADAEADETDERGRIHAEADFLRIAGR